MKLFRYLVVYDYGNYQKRKSYKRESSMLKWVSRTLEVHPDVKVSIYYLLSEIQNKIDLMLFFRKNSRGYLDEQNLRE